MTRYAQCVDPYTLVVDGEMFLTYAESEQLSREAFGADASARVRKQPKRKASEFLYTFEGETIAATVVGKVPAEFADVDAPSEPAEPAPVVEELEQD